MREYPQILLPVSGYLRLEKENVSEYFFVRETKEDIQACITNQTIPEDYVRKIVEPQSSREVFALSLFLYGVYSKEHVGVRKIKHKNGGIELTDEWDYKTEINPSDIVFELESFYPLFLFANDLNSNKIEFDGARYFLSCIHKPSYVNYWHFQLFVEDEEHNLLSKNSSSSKNKKLARFVLERYIAKAVCGNQSIIRKFPFNYK
jgi:hypothetical protein